MKYFQRIKKKSINIFLNYPIEEVRNRIMKGEVCNRVRI